MKIEFNNLSRRGFLKSSSLAGLFATVGIGSNATILTSCCSKKETKLIPLKEPGTYYIPDLQDKATDGKELKAGIIGCGGQGSGDTLRFLKAANGVTITALGDTFKDRVDHLAKTLKEKNNVDISEEKRFVGLDAYQKVIDSGVDVVLIATPPYFRPIHFQYAVDKGVHAFLEKPICVDPAGYRSIIATAKQARTKNLCVVVGTQRHHQRSYVESYQKIMEGYMGEITGGVVYWNQPQLWYKNRDPKWSEFEWMVRDWVNWKWLSGDHIVEQHIHNIDVFTWFSGLKPVKCVGVGSRHRRVTGDQFDNFSVDFEMENGIHLHSMCRQIDGCAFNVSEFIQGTKGSWSNLTMEIKDLAGNVVWKFDHEAEKAKNKETDSFVLEMVNWINHIRSGQLIEQASELAVANLAAIMGREAAYTGQEITRENMMASPLDVTPMDLNPGKMDMRGYVVPVPGTPK